MQILIKIIDLLRPPVTIAQQRSQNEEGSNTAVAKKRTIRKKTSRSGKAQHATEIRRAKRAVSAASTRASSPSSAPDSQPPAPTVSLSQPDLAPSLMKRLLRAAASPFAPDPGISQLQTSLPDPSALTFFVNPLADVARRHVRLALQFRPDLSDPTDAHCRRILTSLAQARINAALKLSPNHDHLLSDSPSSLTDSGGH